MFYGSEHGLGTAGSALQGVTARAVIPPGLSLLDLNCQGEGVGVIFLQGFLGLLFGFVFFFPIYFIYFKVEQPNY